MLAYNSNPFLFKYNKLNTYFANQFYGDDTKAILPTTYKYDALKITYFQYMHITEWETNIQI